MLTIYSLALNQLHEKNFPYWLGQVELEKQKEILTFKDPLAAKRSLLGHILVNYLMGKKSGIPLEEILLARNKYGKPILLNPRGLDFNLSHSGAWIICALAQGPIGLDIEEIKPIDLALTERFFSSSERKYLKELEARAKLEYFYQIWTLKESFLKALGLGLNLDLKNLSFEIEQEISLAVNGQASPYCFWQGKMDSKHIWSICTKKHIPPPQLKHLTLEKIYQDKLIK